jgi:hypothetical protein
MGYQSFILLPTDTDVSIEKIRRVLEGYYSGDAGTVSFESADTRLTVTIDGWNCAISLNSKPSVIEESKEMAEMFAAKRADKDAIAASGVRLEISTDDDENMDFFNDYVEITEQLGKFEGARTWEGAQEEFLD